MFRNGLLGFVFAGGLLLAPLAAAEDPRPTVQALQHTVSDDEPVAEVVPLPPKKAQPPQVKPVSAGRFPSALAVFLPKEPGYTLVLSGILDANLELGPEQSPVLIRGSLIVPEGATLRIKAGTCIHLRAPLADTSAKDAKDQPPAAPPRPDAPNSGVWVWGVVLAEGVTGNPVEVVNQEKQPAVLMLQGQAQYTLEGMRLKDVAVTQTGGVSLWTNCEFTGVPYYALAGGAGLFTHCSFRNCGGIFATYSLGPWSLLARRNLFDGCREGIVLGSDPGETRLIIEKNNFAKTRGADIRVMPVVNAKGIPAAGNRTSDTEFLIGENWYGSSFLEEAELRLVDRRIDPSVRGRLNSRPPAARAYANTGAGVSTSILAATLREQQATQDRLLRAHPRPQPKTAEQPQAAVMSKAVSRPK